MKKTILLVEDEKGISNIVSSYLIKEGYEVLQAFDGKAALELFRKHRKEGLSFHLIILDLMLPKLSGESVIEVIRRESDVPVIMLTAKVEENDRINGFQLGADDYVTKPFSPRELMERVKAILRRTTGEETVEDLELKLLDGRVRINFETFYCNKDGEDLMLTRNEFLILKTLFSKPGKIFTREEIIAIAFGNDYEAFDRAIDTHIKNIRHKLEDNPKEPKVIRTVYGVGYKAGGWDETSD